MPERFADADACAEAVVARVGREIVAGIPLGIGKPNHLVNALYRRVADDPSLSLRILTALTLAPQPASSELERRLVEPLNDRLFGGYPPLAYAEPFARGELPDNVEVLDFFLAPGRHVDHPKVQQSHVSLNYSHALRHAQQSGINVFAQLVSPEPSERSSPRGTLSLSSNSDVGLDLIEQLKRDDSPTVICGQVNPQLPFMPGSAEVAEADFDLLLEAPAEGFPLVGPPNESLGVADHWLGLHASGLVRDGGTLQLGIGALSDAVVHALLVRHREPALHRRLVETHGIGDEGSFDEGLYGASEMLVQGFLELYEAGILKRRVDDAVIHAGFFLGPRAFYRRLREMPLQEREAFQMTSIRFVNELFGDYERRAAQRRHARFINSGLIATLGGAVVSDGLEDGRVVSGVGGQYNFVAMAHALADARSVLLIRSTYDDAGELRSNIRARYGHVTIPRHLRDVVVTEYGVADLRGQSDGETYARMIEVADARFQDELVRQAKAAGKLPDDYRVPDRARGNRPERLADELAPHEGRFPTLPFGSDITAEERILIRALESLKKGGWPDLDSVAAAASPPASARPYLERLGLVSPRGVKDEVLQRAVVYALAREGVV